jgi:hypothetical protein
MMQHIHDDKQASHSLATKRPHQLNKKKMKTLNCKVKNVV